MNKIKGTRKLRKKQTKVWIKLQCIYSVKTYKSQYDSCIDCFIVMVSDSFLHLKSSGRDSSSLAALLDSLNCNPILIKVSVSMSFRDADQRNAWTLSAVWLPRLLQARAHHTNRARACPTIRARLRPPFQARLPRLTSPTPTAGPTAIPYSRG